MFDLIGTLLEGISGYIGGRYATSKRASFHISAILVSLACGLMFFLAYGLYEFFVPAPNPIGNVWIGLSALSVVMVIAIYLFLVAVHFFEKKNKN